MALASARDSAARAAASSAASSGGHRGGLRRGGAHPWDTGVDVTVAGFTGVSASVLSSR